MRNLNSVLIRTDCSREMGIGHAMRCLALGAALREAGISTRYIMAACLAETAARFEAESFAVDSIRTEQGGLEDAGLTLQAARDRNAELIVLDGYHFGPSYQRIVRPAGILAVFDDPGRDADVVIAPTPPKRPDLYDASLPSDRLLLGAEYLLLRPEFDRWADWRREIIGPARRILVAIGGTDPLNMTSTALAALDRIPGNLEIVVATAVEVDRRAERPGSGEGPNTGAHDVRVEQGVSDMASLMAWADVGIIGGGTTLWEAAFMGLPSVALIVADNQAPGSAHFERAGCGVVLDSRNSPDPDGLTRTLSEMITSVDLRVNFRDRGRTLVDGKGARRLVAALGAIVAEEGAKRRASATSDV